MMMNYKRCLVPIFARWGLHLDYIVRAGILILFALLTVSPAYALNGRDFAAIYQYTRTADNGSSQQINLSLRLFNYSSATVTNGTLALEGEMPIGEAYGSIANISIPANASLPVSGNFSIPAEEYAQWQAGGLPHLSIWFIDSDGNQVKQPVELIPSLTGELQ